MRLYLVRHAQSAADERGIVQGDAIDTGLSPLGQRQARALASHFAAETERGLHLDAIYASPLQRALETARTVAETLRRGPPIVLETFREISWGAWTGRAESSARHAIHAIIEAWENGDHQARASGGESAQETWLRLREPLDDLAGKHKHDAVLLVAHEGVNRILLSNLLHDGFGHLMNFPQAHAGITILERERGAWYAPVRNAVEHLRRAQCLPSN